MKFADIQKDLKKNLKGSRFVHTMGVVETAEHLAQVHGCDVEKAKLAALLHDCAKYVDDFYKIEMCQDEGIAISEAELLNPGLLHAKCGAIVARKQYDIREEDILHAIRVHTTGEPDMNMLDQIIFIADYIEPGRDKAPRLPELRKLADEDLVQTTYEIMKDTVSYLEKNQKETMDPTTVEAYQYYRQVCKGE